MEISTELLMFKQYIKSYADFPKEGVDFKCTASLCAGKGFRLTNNFMYDSLLKYMPCDKIVGLDARGFIFGGTDSEAYVRARNTQVYIFES